MEQQQEEQYKTYSFITDNTLSPEEKLVKYINIQEGYDFITVEKFREILLEEI